MATVDFSKAPAEQRKVYSRMSGNGKGDSPRNCWSKDYKRNYDRIFKHHASSTQKNPQPCR